MYIVYRTTVPAPVGLALESCCVPVYNLHYCIHHVCATCVLRPRSILLLESTFSTHLWISVESYYTRTHAHARTWCARTCTHAICSRASSSL